MALIVGATVMRDASGNVADLVANVVNESVNSLLNDSAVAFVPPAASVLKNLTEFGTNFNCTTDENPDTGCKYGSQNSFQVIFPTFDF